MRLDNLSIAAVLVLGCLRSSAAATAPTQTPTAVSAAAYFNFALSRVHTDATPSTDGEWVNLSNIKATGPDDRWAQALLAAGGRSEYLHVAVAAPSTLMNGSSWQLRGIEIAVTRKCSDADRCFTDAVGLVRPDRWEDEVIEGRVAADAGAWGAEAGETHTYGGPNELWGISDWTWADVRSSRLSFLLRVKNTTGEPATASVDAVQLKLYWRKPDAIYTPILKFTVTSSPTRTPPRVARTRGPGPMPTNTPVCIGYYNGRGGGSYAIGRAATGDVGCHSGWYRYSGNPVLKNSNDPNDWDAGLVSHPYVVAGGPGGATFLYYVGRKAGAPGQIGLAKSTDGGQTFAKCTVATCGVDNPIISSCSSGTWCGGSFELPLVFYDERDIAKRRFKLFVAGHNDLSGQAGIGYFYSADGTTWAEGTKCSGGRHDGSQCLTDADCSGGACVNANPVLSPGSSGSFDDNLVLPSALVFDPLDPDATRRWKLYYGGFRVQDDHTWLGDLGARSQGGCATAPQPTGPFTKCPNNPILDRQQSKMAEVVVDVPEGGVTLPVRDASVFSSGDAVWMLGFKGASQYNIVSSVDITADTVTLQRPINTSCRVSDGCTIRSLTSVSVYPTAVYFDPSSRRWRGFATGLQMEHERFYKSISEWAYAIEAGKPCPSATPCSSELTKEWKHGGVVLEAQRSSLWDFISSENLTLGTQLPPASR